MKEIYLFTLHINTVGTREIVYVLLERVCSLFNFKLWKTLLNMILKFSRNSGSIVISLIYSVGPSSFLPSVLSRSMNENKKKHYLLGFIKKRRIRRVQTIKCFKTVTKKPFKIKD